MVPQRGFEPLTFPLGVCFLALYQCTKVNSNKQSRIEFMLVYKRIRLIHVYFCTLSTHGGTLVMDLQWTYNHEKETYSGYCQSVKTYG